MAYSHSFSPEFYGTPYETPEVSDRPTTVIQALYSMPCGLWNRMCREVFGCSPDYVDLETALSKVIQTDTVSDFNSPVRVWIDPEGWWTVDVYDSREGDNEV